MNPLDLLPHKNLASYATASHSQRLECIRMALKYLTDGKRLKLCCRIGQIKVASQC